MPEKSGIQESLIKHGISDRTIDEIINISYQKSDDPFQDNANYFCKAMEKCNELVDQDTLCEVMGEMCCCRDGEMLETTLKFAKENSDKPFDEKINLFVHISKPWIIDENHIGSFITGEHETVCSCWNLDGRKPENGIMPVSYCFCCAGFLKFHYEKALNIKLRTDRMVSTLLNGDKRCSVIFEIKHT